MKILNNKIFLTTEVVSKRKEDISFFKTDYYVTFKFVDSDLDYIGEIEILVGNNVYNHCRNGQIVDVPFYKTFNPINFEENVYSPAPFYI